jgi:MFS family permease
VSRLDALYDLVANEEDARVCRDISDAACRVVPRNFFILAVAQVLTKLGDNLASAKTVLAWLMAFVGAPEFLVGLLVPVRESGSMLPQIFIGDFVRRMPRRKPVWIAGSLLQCLAVAMIGLTAATLRGPVAGWAIIGLVVLFSLSRGLNSVASKDILGKTVPKTRRGRLGGISASLSGLLAVAFGLWMLDRHDIAPTATFYGGLLLAAGGTWLLATLIFTALKEYPGETAGGGSAWREAVARLAILRTDRTFRRFVITRALLMCTALSAPYYILLARQQIGAGLAVLGAFVVANGLAISLSAPIWGVFADASSRRVLIAAASIASALGVILFVLVELKAGVMQSGWTHPVAFFLLGVSHSGVRAGRKTYLVDMAGGTKRTDYVAVSNSVIGLALLAAGLFVGALSFLPPHTLILVLSGFGVTGVVMARSLPEVQ